MEKVCCGRLIVLTDFVKGIFVFLFFVVVFYLVIFMFYFKFWFDFVIFFVNREVMNVI